jgi:cell division protein FtsQ
VAVAVVVAVAGLGYTVLFTPLLGVRSVRVLGAHEVPAARIQEIAAVPEQRPMLRVDTDAIVARVAALPGLAGAEVSRSWPSTIEIAVTERTPIAFYDTGERLYLVDTGGVVYRVIPRPPRGLPELQMLRVGPKDPATRAVTTVLAALPHRLRERVTAVRAPTPGSVEFTLSGGTIVRWGDAEQNHRKARVLGVLLSREGHVYDVSSPELPTVS